MKTILVLTDFSKSAQNAAETAVVIAGKLGADILLVNSYLPKAELPLNQHTGLPARDSDFQRLNKKNINNEAARVKKLLTSQANVELQPGLSCLNTKGSLSANVQTILREKDVIMIIMGGRSKTNYNSFFGSDIYAVLNKAICPVLIMPEQKTGLGIKNLVFATDLGPEDITAIKYLAKLSGIFKFNIHLSLISAHALVTDLIEDEDVPDFMTEVSKLNFDNLTFKDLKGDNVLKELAMFTKSIHADMLAMVHKKNSLFWQVFNNDHSKILVHHQTIPVLILPEQWGHQE